LNAPPEDVVMNTSSLRKYASVVGQVGGYKWYQSLLQTLRDVGDKHGGVSVANVATKWVLDSPVVPAVILGARNASHIQDHVKLFDFELDGDDRSRIAKVLAEGRSASEDAYAWERGGRW
jgi:aryl-alcohol dehydrogenase-like predicted oxidoreductase